MRDSDLQDIPREGVVPFRIAGRAAEGAVAAAVAGLGCWLAFPEAGWGLPAVGLGLAATAMALASGRAGTVAAAVLALSGAGAAWHTAWQVDAVENRWEAVRESLIDRAQRRLAATLDDAVATTEALADRGASLETTSREAAFQLLDGGLTARSPERGVVVFDDADRPWAWAGRLREATRPRGGPLRARITPFHVVLEVERFAQGRRAVAQILLDADSAIPDPDATVAARFARATGATLQFYPPRAAPADPDVFDYCAPECNALEVYPDTLFAVRAVPPAQGTLKLAVLERGGRRVAVAVGATVLTMLIAGGPFARLFAVVGSGALLLFTPFGARLWFEPLFSARRFFVGELDPVISTAGELAAAAGLAVVLVAVGWYRVTHRHPAWLGAMAALVVGIPFVLRGLASGVIAPEAGGGIAMWLAWTLPIGLAGTAMAVAAAWAARLSGVQIASAWAPWGAGVLAAAVTLIGLLAWGPDGGWPGWFAPLWVLPLALAALTGPPLRMVPAVAVVAGGAGALFVWGAFVPGNLLNAERDARRLSDQADPFAASALEIFGETLLDGAVPGSAAELYAQWRRSSLARDDYPAALAAWDADGEVTARLDLARLGLPDGLTRAAADRARTDRVVLVRDYTLVPGRHHVLAVPYPTGQVVTVVVGPRSRAVASVRVARFLRGEERLAAAYDMSVAGRPTAGVLDRVQWVRDAAAVRGEMVLSFPRGPQRLTIQVPLGSVVDLVVRGILIAALVGVLAALGWLLGEHLRGELRPGAVRLWRAARVGSYRSRLTVTLALFFFVPTMAFATWSVGRLRGQVTAARDLAIGQTLRDATRGQMVGPDGETEDVAAATDLLAAQLDADLLVYADGRLAHASEPVLAELGLVEPYLPPVVYRRAVLGRGFEDEVVVDRDVGGRRTRVGYRVLGGEGRGALVLAAPRLAEDPRLAHEQFDIFFALLVVTLMGFAAAAAMAAVAGRALSHPVRALRDAAGAVGRGEPLRPFEPGAPGEFVPVMEAFERMAADVASHQRALERALDFTAAVLRNVATGVVALGPDLRVTTVNRSATQLLGVEPTPYEPIDGQTAPVWAPLWDWVRAFLRRRHEIDAEEFTVGDRRIRVQVAALPGVERGCVLAVDDATDLAQAERILAWGEMARQVAHEIKNPLTPIRLGVQHLQRSYRGQRGDFGAALDQTSRQILAEIERLDAIARAFSRFGAPPAEAAPLTPHDLGPVLREAASLYAMGSGTTVEVDAPRPAVATVRSDELKEVIINLVENARNAGATAVGVQVTPTATGVRLAVRDNGQGIAPENLIHIFEPQFSTTTSGTGLGLAICKRLVESWRGTIRAESTLGRGTIVVIDLPAPTGGEDTP